MCYAEYKSNNSESIERKWVKSDIFIWLKLVVGISFFLNFQWFSILLEFPFYIIQLKWIKNSFFSVQVQKDDSKQSVTIKAAIVPSEHESNLIEEYRRCKKDGIRFCPECTLGLEIKHTDVLILSQYVRPDGCMLPRRVTGLCKRQQKRIGTMVTMAHKAGEYTKHKNIFSVWVVANITWSLLQGLMLV